MEAAILMGLQASGKTMFYRERFFHTHVRISLDLLSSFGRLSSGRGHPLEQPMLFADYSPVAVPTLAEQRDALQKGLGRAVLWAQSGHLADEPLLDACLHDKRFDRQCEDERGEWLWGILGSGGAVQRLRRPILEAVRQVTTERDAYQLCDLASHYAKTGDSEFKTSLYEFVERKPIADCPWIGEETLLELGGEEAFRFIARIRGKLLETRPWDWDIEALIGRAVEKFGEQQVRNLLNDLADPGTSRFAAAWRAELSQATKASRQSHAERMRAITLDGIMEAIKGNDRCFWLRGWGMHADEAAIGVVLGHLRAAQEPSLIAKLLRALWNRAMPEFDPWLIELCRHADPDVRRSAFNALKCNSHPLVRAFAIAECENGVRNGQVVSLFISNYEQGDEHRIAEAIELPDDSNEFHWLLMDVVKVLEKNEEADCSHLGVAAYALTPCENCRGDAARLLYNRHAAPRWLIEECRYDSNEGSRKLWEQASGATEAIAE